MSLMLKSAKITLSTRGPESKIMDSRKGLKDTVICLWHLTDEPSPDTKLKSAKSPCQVDVNKNYHIFSQVLLQISPNTGKADGESQHAGSSCFSSKIADFLLILSPGSYNK